MIEQLCQSIDSATRAIERLGTNNAADPLGLGAIEFLAIEIKSELSSISDALHTIAEFAQEYASRNNSHSAKKQKVHQSAVGLPELAPVSILEGMGLGRVSAYDVARILPKGIVVRLGEQRMRINVQKLRAWIDGGGQIESQPESPIRTKARSKSSLQNFEPNAIADQFADE